MRIFSGQERSQKFVFGGIKVFLGWIKLLNSLSGVILPHKKFSWTDFFFFWGGDISRYPPPVATPLSRRFTGAGASNESGVIENGDFRFFR